MDNELMKAALQYAELGWKVVACHYPIFQNGTVRCSCYLGSECGKNTGKHPMPKHGLDEATTDRETISRWWKQWPDANIALVGIGVVIDIDPRHGGNVADLNLNEDEIDTPIQASGTGGNHLIYKAPEGKEFGNQRGNLPKGIDVRGTRGYIIAAPSMHQCGVRYEWVEGYEPWTTPMLELPPKLIDLIKPTAPWYESIRIKRPPYQQRNHHTGYYGAVDPKARARRLIDTQIERLRETTVNRNDMLNKVAFIVAGSMGTAEMSEEEVFHALATTAKDIGLENNEIPKTILSGMRKGVQNEIDFSKPYSN